VPVHQAQALVGGIRQNIQPARAIAGGDAEEPFEPRLKEQQNRFDMFAGAEAVDAEIDAIASEVALADVAHLDRVGQSAAGLDGEIGKDRMSGVAIDDLERFRARTETAAVDFIFIGRPPIMVGRRVEGLSNLRHGEKHFPWMEEDKEQLLENVLRIFRGCSQALLEAMREEGLREVSITLSLIHLRANGY
jgi:hypothetical protein